jgi:hypothetical protein
MRDDCQALPASHSHLILHGHHRTFGEPARGPRGKQYQETLYRIILLYGLMRVVFPESAAITSHRS